MAELEPIRPDRPTVWNGLEVSFGIAPILSTLANLANDNRRDRTAWTLYLINVQTLIRDRKDHDKQNDGRKIAQAILDDCSVLAQYIAAYSRLTVPPQLKQTALVCFYLPHYSTVPKQFMRDKPLSGVEDIWRIQDEVEKLLKEKGWVANYEGAEIVFCIPNPKAPWPHRGLLQDLLKYKDDLLYRKTLMISHIPSDMHLSEQFKDFSILESFTGKIKVPKEFGEKVFKDPNLPWNKYVHLLLGDSKLLKAQITAKQKRKLKEMAEQGHWNLLPDKQILKNIIELHWVPIETYIKQDM